ncbi:MAG TPA: rhomboid family intramembrane serine protease [Chloroflexi bacterium]|nr:rhomboid family intramembrane serine protease [Chloroflexota bacterium]
MTRIDWQTTALERTQGVRRHLMRHAFILGTLVALLWGVELFDWLVLRGALDGLGIQPRTLGGLQAIVVAPWLHAGFGHLFANTIPLVVLGWFVMLRRTSDFFIVCLAALLASGLGIWFFGGAATIHLGVSGVVFGLFGYLLARGYYERSGVAIVLALVAFLIYGGMVWGMLPLQRGVSWQGHLFGFVGGAIVAYLQVRGTHGIGMRRSARG